MALTIDGILTADRQAWLDDAFAYCEHKYGDANNTVHDQLLFLQTLDSSTRCVKLDGQFLEAPPLL